MSLEIFHIKGNRMISMSLNDGLVLSEQYGKGKLADTRKTATSARLQYSLKEDVN